MDASIIVSRFCGNFHYPKNTRPDQQLRMRVRFLSSIKISFEDEDQFRMLLIYSLEIFL